MATVSAWVSPRVNRPEPWARGTSPTSTVIGRMSVRPRPSIRMPSSRTIRRTVFFWMQVEEALADARLAPGGLEQLGGVAAGALGPDGVGDRLAQRRDPARQVVGEPEQEVGGRLGVRQRAVALGELDAEEAGEVAAACTTRRPG